MPALSTAEHTRVRRETRAARNAHARRRRASQAAQAEAERWCQTVGATWQRWGHFEGTLVTVRVPGFHPVTAPALAQAVATLDQTIRAWCESRATHGPTGASLTRLRGCLRGD